MNIQQPVTCKWYMWSSAGPIFSEFLCDNEKAFLLYVWTLGESYLNTIFWIFQMEFFAYICIALSFVLKKLNENQFFFEPVCRWLLWQLRRDSAKKLCGQHEENVGKYILSIFRINLSELFLPFWSFPCSLKSEPPPSLIELEESKLFLHKNLPAQQSTIERGVVKVFSNNQQH